MSHSALINLDALPPGDHAVVELSLWMDILVALQSYPEAFRFLGRDITYKVLLDPRVRPAGTKP